MVMSGGDFANNVQINMIWFISLETYLQKTFYGVILHHKIKRRWNNVSFRRFERPADRLVPSIRK